MLFGKKQSLVGLDIGSHTVKVVELEPQSNKTYKLTNWGISQPLAEAIVDGEIMDRQLVTDAISNLMESRGIKAKNVVAAVSGRAVIVKKITMNKFSPDGRGEVRDGGDERAAAAGLLVKGSSAYGRPKEQPALVSAGSTG